MNRSSSNTVLVMGAGHNGLICASALAMSGYNVNVLEARSDFGGAAATSTFSCGCQVSRAANVLSLLDQAVLNLIDRHIDVEWSDLFLVPNPQRVIHSADSTLTIRALPVDDLVRDLSSQTGESEVAIQGIFRDLDLAASSVSDLWTDPYASRALFTDRLNTAYLGCARDFLDGSIETFTTRHLESEQLRVAFGALGSLTTALLSEAGSAFCLLYLASGNLSFSPNYALVRGGIGTISQLLVEAAKAEGVRLVAGEGVSAIQVRDDEVECIVTTLGRRLIADYYVSGFGPTMTQRLCISVDEQKKRNATPEKPITALHETACAKLICLLPAAMARSLFRQGDEPVVQRVFCAGTFEHNRSADAANRGIPSELPTIELTAPAIIGAERSCTEHIPVCIYGLYFPYDWCRSVLNEQKLHEEICSRMFRSLDHIMPGLSKLLVIKEILTPLSLEREFGMLHGDVDHGSFAHGNILDNRGYSMLPHGSSPTRKLFNCSAGIHPGGLVTGRPGLTCAKTIIGLDR